MCRLLIEIVNNVSGLIGRSWITIHCKEIVSRANINIETLFDQAEVFIKVAAECSQAPGVIWLNGDR